MKPFILAILCLLVTRACFAGDFINLGFNDPDLSHALPFVSGPIIGQSAPTGEAIRGWTLSSENSPTPQRVYIGVGTTPPVSLDWIGTFPGTGIDFGTYGLYLASPSQAPGSLQPIYHLSQLGMIPIGAMDLVFFRDGATGPGLDPNFVPFKILINGQSIPYTETGIGFANVSAFAGQTVNLEFDFPKGDNTFDIAGFTIAPEPPTYALFGLGAVALWWQCRRRPNS